jgi:GTPase SAR1 family protein
MSIIWMKGMIYCPVCSHRFHLSRAPLRPPLGAGAPTEADEHIARALGIVAPDLPKVVPPPSGLWARLRRRIWIESDSFDGPSKVCPNCQLPLPFKTANGEAAGRTIAVIGAINAGKSNYLGVLVKYLRDRYRKETDFSLLTLSTFDVDEHKPISSDELYRKRYGNRLFATGGGLAVTKTFSAETEHQLRVPLLYRLEPGKSHHPIIGPRRPIDLSLFDASGEDLGDEDNNRRFCSFIEAAAGIILLIDPTELPEVRRRLPVEFQDRFSPVDASALEVVRHTIIASQKRRGRKTSDKIKVPVAVVFTKCDLLEGMCDRHVVFGDSRHRNGFDADDACLVADRLEEFVQTFDTAGVVSNVRREFPQTSLFAVSAFGEQPGSDHRIGSISPTRIADPLLWILWKLGYLRRRRSR